MAIFTNQATLSYNGITRASNIATGELVEALSVTKTAAAETYTVGDDTAFVISLTNTGAAALENLTLTDDLGGYAFGEQTLYPLSYVPGSVRYYVNGTLQPAPTVTAGPPLTVTGISVPAGGDAIIVYEATVNEYAPRDTNGAVTNTAALSGANLANDVSAAETIAAVSEPNLSVSKSLSPLTVTENDRLTYTFIVQNTGNTPAEADANVVISDTFDPQLSAVTAELNGAPLTAPTDYTYDEADGAFATVPGRITVPAAQYVRNPDTGALSVVPGTAVLTVSGTV